MTAASAVQCAADRLVALAARRGALVVYAESLEARIAAGERSPDLVEDARAVRVLVAELEAESGRP